MKVHYPKLYNMTHLLAAFKGSNNNNFYLLCSLFITMHIFIYCLLLLCCCIVCIENSDDCVVLWFNVTVKLLQSCRDLSCAY